MTLPRVGPPTTIRLPPALRNFLKRRAKSERRHFGHLVVKILEDWANAQGYSSQQNKKENGDDS